MADEQTKIEAIKGFDANFQCRNFQFEIGKTYTQDGEIVLCVNGFHAIEGHPLEVFNYYAAAGSRFAIVECSGDIARGPPPESKPESKIASATITIKTELHLYELIQRTVEWVTARAKPENGASATGDYGAASATGDYGVASATGTYGAASATGFHGAASATGTCGAASATGTYGAASATGQLGVASATGQRGAASATGQRGAASATGHRGAASATGDLGAASATGDYGAASATSTYGAASATGFHGAASATGHRGAASATGDYGAASATGNLGAASATGDLGVASATGASSVAMASGIRGRVSGEEGCALFLVNRNLKTGVIHHAWAGRVGRNGIKPNTFYTLDDKGTPKEAKA